MATATATPPSKTPDVQTLRKRRASVQAHRDATARRLDEIFQSTDPMRVITGAESVTQADRRRARAQQPELQRDLDLADADLSDLDDAIRTAEDADVRARQAAAHQQLRSMMPELDQALRRVADLRRRAEPLAVAAGLGGLARPWLADETPSTGSWYAAWRRHWVSHGLLD